MKSTARLLSLALLLSLFTAACVSQADTQSAIQTGVAQTLQISQLQTAAAAGGQLVDAEEEPQAEQIEESTPTPSDTPTNTYTPTPDIPQLSVSQNTNCRSGPAVYYGFVTTVNVGQVVEVVGVHAQGNDYVIIKNPNGAGNCWLWLRYANKTDFSAYNLTSYNTPATPTPTFTPTPEFNWSGSWQMWVGALNFGGVAINQSGNSITGSFVLGADTISFTASLSADRQVATGTWTNSSGPTGTFKWQIKASNINQFVGNIDAGLDEWCGSRQGASKPSPCLWP